MKTKVAAKRGSKSLGTAKRAPKAKLAPKTSARRSVRPSSLEQIASRFRPSFDAAQAALAAQHGIGIGKGTAWSYDQRKGELRFTSDQTQVVARASLLGSWANGSWMWAWSNDTIAKAVAKASRDVRKSVMARGIAELTTGFYFASAETVERVAVASFGLLGARGCYFPRTATGKLVFVLHAIGERVPVA
jgi:hypothetical protein